jgi:hypothetical protein
MNPPETLLEVREHAAPGYLPLVDYDTWRVAVLNYISELEADQLYNLQRHNETDEVFVLLRGRCILFLGEGDEVVKALHAVNLEPFKLYNVRRGVWHNHTLSADASVLVVENRDTTYDNSPFIGLSAELVAQFVLKTRELWGN